MKEAQVIFPALRWAGRSVADVWPEVRGTIDKGVGGFVVFGGHADGMRDLVSRALDHAGRPLVFAADLERGAGQQLAGATPFPPAAALAKLGQQEIGEAARVTAREAAAAGIGWLLAPVADLDIEPANPIVGTRSFGAEADAVSEAVRTWIAAAQDEGVHACAKHFPGHGRTTADSHTKLPVVDAGRDALETDMAPFKAAIEAGTRSVMMAHVSYMALDPSGAPASLSPVIIGFLRNELGFDGLVASDALIMGAITASRRLEVDPGIAALQAGCDVLLYPRSVDETAAALRAAVDSGTLSRDQVEASVARVEAAAASARISVLGPSPERSHRRALALAVASISTLRGSLPDWRPGELVQLHIIDDDAESAAPPVAERTPAGVAIGAKFAGSLERCGARLISAKRAWPAAPLIAVFAEVRGWKGRSNLDPSTVQRIQAILEGQREALVLIFGHPRLADQLSAAKNIICAWCGDDLMQEAAAEFLMGWSAS